jgi:hypothetical protein
MAFAELYDLISPIITRSQTMLHLSKNNDYIAREIIGEKQDKGDNIDTSSYQRTLTDNSYNSLKTLKSKITD